MIKVPDRIHNLKPYVAGKTIAEVKKEFNVNRISKLASNENRLGCSPVVKEAIFEAIKQIQDYPDPVSRDLRAEISRRNSVDESEVIVAAGSESILSILCRSLTDPDSNIITANATFVGIYVQAGVIGCTVKRVPVTKEFGFDSEKMLEAIDEKTRMVYLANPNNPTGTYMDKAEYNSFVERVPQHVLIVADEAYFEYAKDVDDYPSALDYRKENVIVTRTFSKGYGLAGFRIGYAIADSALIEQLMKCKLTFEPTTLAQAAALAAIRDEKFLDKSVKLVENEREKLYRFFQSNQTEFVKSISNSVMIVFENEEESINFTRQMLENGVILRRLSAFGLPNCVRITIGTAREMDHFKEIYLRIRR
ncbi:histidinol-phosphate transaminase [soil metagenome]